MDAPFSGIWKCRNGGILFPAAFWMALFVDWCWNWISNTAFFIYQSGHDRTGRWMAFLHYGDIFRWRSKSDTFDSVRLVVRRLYIAWNTAEKVSKKRQNCICTFCVGGTGCFVVLDVSRTI